MATNIQSTQLDFDAIKTKLKTYLAQQTEFADYNFEASGLSNVLDVLAYNTHFNGLIANFALNESFLNTAQLRSSVVSHAEALGYNPRSVTSATAYVNISVTVSDSGRPSTITLPKYTTFNTSIDDVTYTFYTLDDHTATDDGTGSYSFLNNTGTTAIPIKQGTIKTKTFYAGTASDRQIYVIPDTSIDTSTTRVSVYTSATSSDFLAYTKLYEAVSITETSSLYQLRESPNGFFELLFSDGVTTGLAPVAGNKIVVSYLSSKGASANGGSGFTPTSTITVDGNPYNLSTVTSSAAAGGSAKEDIESIRFNAPITFAAQQRLVTADDYKALILSKYSGVEDCIAWGGEDNIPATFGKVFVSLKFPDSVSTAAQTVIKDSIQANLIRPLSVMSINTDFVDPTVTYLECQTFFTFNPNKTGITLKSTEDSVINTIVGYFNDNLQGFSKSFRRSNVLTLIDDISEAILNSRMDVNLQQRFTPTLGTSTAYTLYYPVALAAPDDENYIVTSNTFTYNGSVCSIRNQLSSTILQVIDGDGNIVINNLGNYQAANGKVTITGFAPATIIGGQTQIKLTAVPANQSTVRPLRNYVLDIDATKSYASGIVDYDITQVSL
jgi:hypothetical protein